MIQRKQTLYLIAVVVITACSVLFNLEFSRGTYVIEGQAVPARHGMSKTTFEQSRAINTDNQIIQRVQVAPVNNEKSMYFALASALMAAVSIFMFKNLALQLRLVSLNFVLILGMIGTLFIDDFQLGKSFESVTNHAFAWQIVLLVLIPVFNFLAIKGIRSDIELLASADRLR